MSVRGGKWWGVDWRGVKEWDFGGAAGIDPGSVRAIAGNLPIGRFELFLVGE